MEAGRSLLPLSRAATNIRRTRLFLVLLGLVGLPIVAYVGQYLAFFVLIWLIPLAGETGIIAFIVLDALLVLLLMVLTLAWMYHSASSRLLRALHAIPLEENDAREFARATENMAIAAGLPPPALYVIETPAANVLAAGLSPETSAVIATRGALRVLDRRELEGVAAHALAQIGNRDTRFDTVLAAAVRWLRLPGTFVAAVFRGLTRLASRFGVVGWGCFGALCLYMGVPMALAFVWGFQEPMTRPIAIFSTAFGVYVFLGGPLIAALLVRVVSRERKHLADAEAVQLTRYPVGLARALAKIEAAGSSYAGARPETANLHFADPIATGASWFSRVFDSHPPARDRIEVISRLGGRVMPSEVQDAANLGRQYAAELPPEQPRQPAAPLPPEQPRRPVGLNLIRVTEETSLLANASTGAAVRAQIHVGTRLTVLSEKDGFLEVITPSDEFGFIPPTAPYDDVSPPVRVVSRKEGEEAAG